MFCPVCGTEAPGGANFCAKCGGAVNVEKPVHEAAAPTPAPEVPARKSKRGMWLWIGGAVVASAGLFALIQQSADQGSDDPHATPIALAQRPGNGTQAEAYAVGELHYGAGGQGQGEAVARPAGEPPPITLTDPDTVSPPPPPAETPKTAMMAAPQPKAALTAPAPKAADAKPKTAPAKKDYVATTHLTPSFDPDWAAYRADKDTDNTPGLYVHDTADRIYSIHVLRLDCAKPAYENYFEGCKNHTVDAAFAIGVTISNKSETTDCPSPYRPEDGCTGLWREKGAAVIAAARAAKQ
jgi:hypothetical protein